MWVVRRVVRHRQDAVIQEAIVVPRMRLSLEAKVKLVALAFQERLAIRLRLAVVGQCGQVLVGQPQDARPGKHLHFDAIAKVALPDQRRRPSAGFATVPLASGMPHFPDPPIDALDHRVGQANVRLEREAQLFSGQVLLDAALPEAERLQGLSAIRGIEGFLQRAARGDSGQQLERVQDVALARGVGAEQHGQLLERRLHVSERLVAPGAQSRQHGLSPGVRAPTCPFSRRSPSPQRTPPPSGNTWSWCWPVSGGTHRSGARLPSQRRGKGTSM